MLHLYVKRWNHSHRWTQLSKIPWVIDVYMLQLVFVSTEGLLGSLMPLKVYIN